jgi:hypothetical protein
MLLLHRKRLVIGSKVVSLSNTELKRFGVSRQAKYRAYARLERAGLLTIQPWKAGRPTEVEWSDPPSIPVTPAGHLSAHINKRRKKGRKEESKQSKQVSKQSKQSGIDWLRLPPPSLRIVDDSKD